MLRAVGVLRSGSPGPLHGLRIAVDATSLGGGWSGTERAIYELMWAMAAARPDQAFSILVGPHGAPVLAELVDTFDQVALDVVGDRSADTVWRYDLVLRGNQFFVRTDLDWLTRISTAFAIRFLDFITYERPSYADSPEMFEEVRAIVDDSLRRAAGVIWVSQATGRHARALGVDVAAPVQAVVYEGLDHEDRPVRSERPASLPDDLPYVLQLGNAFEHKNRLFSMRIAGRLRAAGWPGRLVLAGAYPTWGGSMDAEQALRDSDPGVDAAVVDVGHVSEEERAWLIDNAVLGLFPSGIEGFGLPPFEFARRGVPTVSSRCFSVGELQPPDIPHLGAVDDLDAAVAAVLPLLDDAAERARIAARIDEVGRFLTWDRSARGTWAVLDATAAARWPNRARVHGLAELWSSLPARSLVVPAGSRRQQAVRGAVERLRSAR